MDMRMNKSEQNKEELINSIKAWLQMFGDRDNECFNVQLPKWRISMQYDYSLDGFRIEPNHWCCWGFKHVHDNKLQDRTYLELLEIINELNNIKSYW